MKTFMLSLVFLVGVSFTGATKNIDKSQKSNAQLTQKDSRYLCTNCMEFAQDGVDLVNGAAGGDLNQLERNGIFDSNYDFCVENLNPCRGLPAGN